MMIHSARSKNYNRLLNVHVSSLVHSKIKLLKTIPNELCEIKVAQYYKIVIVCNSVHAYVFSVSEIKALELCICSFTLHETDCFSVDKKNQLDVTFVFFISLLIVAQHVSGNHVPIIRR